jgi:hypothetical protein
MLLLPGDANARARAITWMFAAINTVEPPILDLVRCLPHLRYPIPKRQPSG